MNNNSRDDRFLSQPMPKVLLPLAAGICAAEAVPAGGIIAAVLFLTALCIAVFLRRSRFATAATLTAVGLYGFAVMTLRRVEPLLPEGGTIEAEMVVVDFAQERCEARLVRIKVGGAWCETDEKATLRVYGADLVPGETITATLTIDPFPEGGYGRLLLSRGLSATGRLDGSDIAARGGRHCVTARILAARLRRAAAERLGRLELTPRSRAAALAMTLGERSGLDGDTKRSYASSGASHILAVSGLHVGIVFLLVNLLLFWLPLLRHGLVLRGVAGVALIWLYAAVTGLSPSVVRAACMFTGLQAAIAASRTRGLFNMLCGAGAVMLGVSPAMLFDVGFQMSFIAVAAITLWFPALYARVRCGRRVLDAMWSLFLVGAVCTAALAPLTASVFGRISLAGIVLNPVIILTANIVILSSLLWIVAPVPFAAPLFERIIETAAGVQNGTVDAAASMPWSSVEMQLAPWAAAAVYALFIALTVWPGSKTRPKKLTLHHDDPR